MERNEVVYLCPVCGKMVRWPLSSQESPTTYHHCTGNRGQLAAMAQIWPPAKEAGDYRRNGVRR